MEQLGLYLLLLALALIPVGISFLLRKYIRNLPTWANFMPSLLLLLVAILLVVLSQTLEFNNGSWGDLILVIYFIGFMIAFVVSLVIETVLLVLRKRRQVPNA